MKYVSYIALFGVSALLASIICVVVLAVHGLGNCNPSGSGADRYLSYCEINTFGNYDQGAFYYGLEPEAVDNLKKADVLFLGNSRSQFAFSSDAAADFFNRRGMRYFLLGFGYGELSDFPLALIRRHHLQPKALIVNADPFFSHERTSIGHSILDDRIMLIRGKYLLKKLMIVARELTCKIASPACKSEGVASSLYRSRSDGRWDVSGLLPPGHLANHNIPFVLNTTPISQSSLDQPIGVGKEFLAQVPVSPACIVLTGVPVPEYNSAEVAAALAQALGTKVLNVSIPNLATIDRNHMTADSVKRWSNAFFNKLDQVLEGCSL